MKKTSMLLSIFLIGLIGLFAKPPQADSILTKIDANMVIDQAVIISEMRIDGRGGMRTIKQKSWMEGDNKALVEYLAPAREKGKKMLKLDDMLWNYTPEPHDRIITISGHLLRQSVMGSDLSYEDITENDALLMMYQGEVLGDETLKNRDCWVLQLTAKNADVTYFSRKMWVDKERWVPLREERFAKSGKLLKTTQILEVFQIGQRWYPRRMHFKDALTHGKGTEYYIESIDLNAEIPAHMFSKAALRK